MAFCTNCGAKLEDGHRFCSRCGTMVADTSPAASPIPEKPIHSAPVTDPIPEAPTDAEQVTDVHPSAPVEDPELPDHTAPAAAQNEPPRKKVMDADDFVFAPETSAYYNALPLQFDDSIDQDSDVGSDVPDPQKVTATPDAPETAGKRKVSRPRRKFLPAFCSVLLCILLVVLMLPTFTLLTAQNVIKQETLLATLNRIDMNELPASFLDETDRHLKRLSFAEYLCDTINSDMDNLNDIVISYRWDDLTPKTLQRFLDETTFLPFFANHAEGVIDAILSGKDSYTVPAKSIKQLLDENKDPLLKKMSISVSDRNYDLFVDFLADEGLNTEIELPEVEESALGLINAGLSFFVIGGLCLVMVLLVVLLFVTNRKDRMFAVKDTGISLVVGSGLFLLVTLAARILSSIFVDEDPLVYLITTLVSAAAERILPVVAIVLALGVILLLINFFVRMYQRKHAA